MRTIGLTLLLAVGVLAVSAQAPAAQTGWRPAAAPLMTRWAREVRPDRVRTDYPRPLVVRKEWKSLNGLWEFAFDDRNEGRDAGWHTGRPLPERILVPFTFEAALSGIGKGTEIHERVWYRRTFEVPPSWKDRRTRLNFNACDWETTVWVNGKEMGTHQGGYDPFSFDVTDVLKPGGPQEVVVAVYDPADPRRGAYQPKGKQLGSEGIWYTRTTGIWQSVWLEPVHAAAPASYWIHTQASPEHGTASVHVSGLLDDRRPVTVEMVVLRKGKEVARTWGSQQTVFDVVENHIRSQKVDRGEIREPYPVPPGSPLRPSPVSLSEHLRGVELWSPENPVLYDLVVRVRQDGRMVDEVRSYCAFRDYRVRGGRLELNGKPYFLRGVLDQGYWPDGVLTPPTDSAIRADVELTRRLGFNMARKHVKVEDPRWYYWCDRLGVAVWQDMPSSHNLSTQAAKQNFTREWQAVMSATTSYPSVLHWIPFNENWGDPGAFQDTIVQMTKLQDRFRPVTDASGWTQRSLTDVIDVHDYSNNLLRHGETNPARPKVVGEYGGIALPIQGHTWTTGWGYQTARDAQGLLRRIRHQTTQLFEAPNLSGFVYTQLTDVEQEMNGLVTYDRRLKADPEKIAAIFRGESRADVSGGFLNDWRVLGPIPTGTNLSTAQDSAANRAVIEAMLAGEQLPGQAVLDPSEGEVVRLRDHTLSWTRARPTAGSLDFHGHFGRPTSNAVAYAVATFDSPREVRNATLLFSSDDGAKVWLNGKLVHTVTHIRGVGLDDDTITGLTLRRGRNVLVVKVAQGIGGWGLAARFEGPDGKILRL